MPPASGETAVLEKLNDHIANCLARAAEAEQGASEAPTKALRSDYERMAEGWRRLASSYQLVERLEQFLSKNKTSKATRPSCPPIKAEIRDENIPAGAGGDNAWRLHQISSLLIQEGDVRALYEHILDAAIDLMRADMGSMQTFDPELHELRLLAWRGFHPKSATFWERVHLDSACTCGLALSVGCRVVVADIETCDSLAGTCDLDEYRRSSIRAVQSTPLISRSGQLLGMISTHWRAPHQPPDGALRHLDIIARQTADLVEHCKTEALLRESEEQRRWLASIVASSSDAIIGKTLEGIITSWNKGAERVLGYAAEEVVGKSIMLLIPADRQDEERMMLERIGRGEPIEHYETVRQCKRGSSIVVWLSISPVKNAEGMIVGASTIARDITERKRSEEQIVVLGREAEHRTKNVLATVLATIDLSKADTSQDLKRAIKGRIQALANVHALFVQSRWTGAELSSLAAQELAPYVQGDDVRIHMDGPRLLLKSETAQAMALVLHELATNAAKYGALSVATGHVGVKWSLAADGGIVVRWIESGGPPVNPPAHRGFGTEVIEGQIRYQADGFRGPRTFNNLRSLVAIAGKRTLSEPASTPHRPLLARLAAQQRAQLSGDLNDNVPGLVTTLEILALRHRNHTGQPHSYSRKIQIPTAGSPSSPLGAVIWSKPSDANDPSPPSAANLCCDAQHAPYLPILSGHSSDRPKSTLLAEAVEERFWRVP